jgi:pimeloyl-[acyl-carrier protein] synthase
VEDLAAPMPAIVTAEMLGVPVSDHEKLKQWSIDFAEILGNFQHQPDRVARVAASVRDMTEYFRAAIRQQETDPHEGLVLSLVQAEVNGIRLTEEEIIANCILTMIGGTGDIHESDRQRVADLAAASRTDADASGRPVAYSFGGGGVAAI